MLEKDELWIELDEAELFDELLDKLEALDVLTREDETTTKDELMLELEATELFEEDELLNEIDELTREDELITDELEPGIKLELVAVEFEDAFELTVFPIADELELPTLSADAPHPAK